jgi:hypothetical protein
MLWIASEFDSLSILNRCDHGTGIVTISGTCIEKLFHWSIIFNVNSEIKTILAYSGTYEKNILDRKKKQNSPQRRKVRRGKKRNVSEKLTTDGDRLLKTSNYEL